MAPNSIAPPCIFISKQSIFYREREKQEKKEAKLKKLHKLVTEGESKHEFRDEKYDEAREAATDRVHEAFEQVFSDSKPGTSGASQPGPSGMKRKVEEDKKVEPVAKKGLWIAGDLNESDFEDSSDDEEETTQGSS